MKGALRKAAGPKMRRKARLQIRSRDRDGARVVYLDGEIDAATISRFQKRMEEIAAGGHRVVVNCRGLQFANTATFGLFYHFHDTISRSGGYFAICELQPKIRDILRMLGLEKELHVFDDMSRALEAAQRSSAGRV